MPRVCAARRTAEGNPLARYLTVVVLILANPDELIHRDVMKNLVRRLTGQLTSIVSMEVASPRPISCCRVASPKLPPVDTVA
jgi:hypothetical protein